MSDTSLVDLLDQAGLTGRGGAAFSTATKLRAAQRHGADVIVNACDGELGAVKDAWVVDRHLDELTAGAQALRDVGGHRSAAVRYAAHRGSATAARLAGAGLDVLEVPDRYVSSEETSLIAAAHGALARPMTKRAPFVTGGADSRGRKIRPTLVVNAETAWRVAQIQDRGATWFRSFGTPDEPGPRLASLHGHVAHAGVVQSQAGIPLASFLSGAGAVDPASTVLVGGLAGVYLSAAEAATVTWSTAALATYSGSVGSGVIEVLDPRSCPLDELVTRLGYAAGETAGQCGPCMFGLPTLATDVAAMVAHTDRVSIDRVRGRLGLLRERGACRFPDGISRLTASALRVYADHLELHATRGCPTPAVSSSTSTRTTHVHA